MLYVLLFGYFRNLNVVEVNRRESQHSLSYQFTNHTVVYELLLSGNQIGKSIFPIRFTILNYNMGGMK